MTLPNGLQICAIAFPGVKTVNLRSIIFVGSAYEKSLNNGISHFLEHMMFRGNRRLGSSHQLNLKMEEMGGDLNAVTSFDLTEYWLDFHLDYFKTGLQRFCHFLQEPLFEDIELERSIILEELKADYNENNQLIDADGISAAELWKGHGLGLQISGTTESINQITRDDLSNWYQSYYQPSNMLIGITGDIDTEETFQMLSEQFPGQTSSRRQSYPIVKKNEIEKQLLLIEHKDNQHSIQWSFPTYPLNGDNRIQYQLIRRILDDGSSSRLQRLVREERGLVYDVSAEMLYFNSGAVLSINSLIGEDRLSELISVFAELIHNLVETGVTQEELDLAKRRYQIALDCNQDSPQGVLFEALAPMIHPDVYLYKQTLMKLSAITLNEINATLHALLHQEKTCFTLVGPAPEEHRQMLEKTLRPWLQK